MIELDENALICDLAETYQIYDYRSLPVQLVATLSAGLRGDARIVLKAAGAPASQETIILAAIADNLALLRAGFSKDSNKKPQLFTDAIFSETKQKTKGFRTADAFNAELRRIRGE